MEHFRFFDEEKQKVPESLRGQFGEARLQLLEVDLGDSMVFPLAYSGPFRRGPLAWREFVEESGELVLKVYVTKAFVDESLRNKAGEIRLAELVKYELDQAILGKTHLEAVVGHLNGKPRYLAWILGRWSIALVKARVTMLLGCRRL